jgi:hypothetical protein
MEKDDQAALTHNFRTADIVEIDDDIPLFFWIVDGREAVFAFPGYTDQSIELRCARFLDHEIRE